MSALTAAPAHRESDAVTVMVVGSVLERARELMGTDPAAAGLMALEGLAVARDVDDPQLRGQLAYLAAQARSREGRNAEAIALIGEASRAFAAAGDPVAELRVDLGRMHVLNELGRHAAALDLGRAAQRRLSHHDLADDDRWIGPTFSKNLGVTLGFMARHAEALEAYAGAMAGYRDLGMEDEVAPLLHNEACELLALGRPAEALAKFRRAAARFAKAGESVAATESRRDGATAHLHLGHFEAALRRLEATRHTFSALGLSGEVHRTSLAVGAANLVLGRLHEAEGALQDAADGFERLGLPHDRAVAMLGLGRALGRRGLGARAADALTTAAELADACGDMPLWAMATLEHGHLETDPRGAIDRALGGLARGDWPVETADAHLRGAAAALAVNDLGAARRHLAAAWTCVDRAPREDLRRRASHMAGRVALAEGRAEDAVTHLKTAATSLRGGSLDLRDHLARLRYMDDGAGALNDLVVAELAAGRTDAAAEALDERKAWVLRTQLRGNVAGPSMSGVAEAGPRAAGSGAIGVSWQAHDGQLRAFVRRSGAVSVHELGALEPIETVMEQLEAQWVRLRGGGPVVARFAERMAATTDHLLTELRRRLIDPLELEPGSRLVLSPDGAVNHVPFAALGGREGPLVASHEVSVVASSALAGHHAVTLDPAAPVVLVAPDPEGLPASLAEVDALAGILPSARVLVGREATKTNLADAIADAHHVHLACHGRFRTDAPFASDIELADGWVPAARLAEMAWTGTTAVLSACAVGRSAALGGERAGMARALLGAGAKAVVVAKWDVPDGATAGLLTEMYRTAVTGEPLPTALQRAQLSAARDGAHPVGWAAFEVMHR